MAPEPTRTGTPARTRNRWRSRLATLTLAALAMAGFALASPAAADEIPQDSSSLEITAGCDQYGGPGALPAIGAQLSKLCGARSRTHVLVLAQAPGDLGTLAVRLQTPCRA